jgi:hypothetical protein
MDIKDQLIDAALQEQAESIYDVERDLKALKREVGDHRP